MTVTELGCMGVKPGLNIMDESTPEGEIFMGVYKKINAAPGAPHRIYLGLQSDDPSRVWGFFDWDSIEDHVNFAKTFGGEAVKDLPKVLTHGEFSKHIAATPSLPEALRSHPTDVFTLYFPSDISAAEKDATAKQLQHILEHSFGNNPEVKATSYGWEVGNNPAMTEQKGPEADCFIMAFVGWSNIEAYKKACGTEAYIEAVRSIKGIKASLRAVNFQLSCHVLDKKTE